jgi:NAD(P)-dependent dehydrogenase (short-subunit alcohol dehydrogenase family)
MNAPANQPVWFITGCSTGFGRELAAKTLSLGYPTVVTARNPSAVNDLVEQYPDLALPLALDVTQPEQVRAALRDAMEKFGHIDVLVNNAGIGYFGSFEESDMNEVRKMVDINFWGLVDMTRAVLPEMRKHKRGTIVNVSSIGGIIAFPGVSFYHATKFAVEAVSESMSHELAPLGIKVLIVEPGPFRTDWAGRSANEAARTIADYADTAQARTDTMRNYSGKQPGDPVRAADAIIKAVEAENPPLRLLLGQAAINHARVKIDALKKDFDGWEAVSAGADFPEGE